MGHLRPGVTVRLLLLVLVVVCWPRNGAASEVEAEDDEVDVDVEDLDSETGFVYKSNVRGRAAAPLGSKVSSQPERRSRDLDLDYDDEFDIDEEDELKDDDEDPADPLFTEHAPRSAADTILNPRGGPPKSPFVNPLEDSIGVVQGIIGLAVVAAFVLQWKRGTEENDAIAKLYAATVLPVLEDQFAYIGFGTPKAASASQHSDCVIYKDGANHFEIYATGRDLIRHCLVTLRLRRRQNLFSVLSDFVMGGEEDRVCIELVLDDNRQTQFILGASVGKVAEEELKEEAPEIEQFILDPLKVPESSAKGQGVEHDLAENLSAISSVWTRAAGSGLSVMTDCAEVLDPNNRVFTPTLIDTLQSLARDGWLHHFLISDEMVTLPESRYRQTSAYEKSAKDRQKRAQLPEDLRQNERGVRFVFKLPRMDVVEMKTDDAMLLLFHQLSAHVAHAAASAQLPGGVHARQQSKRLEAFQKQLAATRDARQSDENREKRKRTADQHLQEDKERAQKFDGVPLKPRNLYG
ncbi:hypothetical protein DIPPA_01530 [Diplonema papillatum]|nr:hypothetical protein DIPPA_01530 [Diplonema papillatum]